MNIFDINRKELYSSDCETAKEAVCEAINNCADLSNADLSDAYLSGAYLRDADLRDADLSGANLSGANLSGIKYNIYSTGLSQLCPQEGSFIAWKKASGKIVKLRITDDALRSSATTRICRCSKAEVLDIQELDGKKSDTQSVCSDYDDSFAYEVGKIVEVQDFDEDRWNECSTGIHFFIDRNDAVNY